jgi:large repetitive protein
MFSRFKTLTAISASILITVFASCSPKKNLDGTPVEDGPVTGVSVDADKTFTTSGGTIKLAASVEGTGSYNKTVSWKILSGSGKIKPDDTTAIFTAELAVDKDGPVVIEATSRGDTTKKGTVTFDVRASTSVVVNVSSWDHASDVKYFNTPNIAVKLFDANKKLVQEGVTDSSGNVAFLGLTPQEYTITEDVPVGYGVLGFGKDGFSVVSGRRVASRRLPLTTGPTYLATGFINTLAVVVGQVYIDKDFSGVREAKLASPSSVERNNQGKIIYSEPGVIDTRLRLTGTDVNGTSVDRTINPDGTGRFEFPGLLSGQYTLTELQNPSLGDWDDTIVPQLERLLTNGRFTSIERTTQVPTAAGGATVKILHNATDRSDSSEPFIIEEGASVGGFMFAESDLPVTGLVYLDRDRDGYRFYPDDRKLIEDPVIIPGATIQISGNGRDATSTSAKDGTYIFDRAVPSGKYLLKQIPPVGYANGYAHAIGKASHFEFPTILGSEIEIVVPQLPASGVNPSTLKPVKDPPPVETTETYTIPVEFSNELSNIMGTVFLDDNGNGIRDGNGINIDPGLVLNVPMRLTGTDAAGNPVEKIASLNTLGEFYFNDLLQGTYKIEQVDQPQNYRDGITRPGFIGPVQVGIGGTPNLISNIVLPAGKDAGGGTPFIDYDLKVFYPPFTKDGYTFGELANPPK